MTAMWSLHLDHSTARPTSAASAPAPPQDGAEGLHTRPWPSPAHEPQPFRAILPAPVKAQEGTAPWTRNIPPFTFMSLPPCSSCGYWLPCSLFPSSGPTFPGILAVDALEPRRQSATLLLVPKMPEMTAWDGNKLLNGYINCKKISRFYTEILMLKTK